MIFSFKLNGDQARGINLNIISEYTWGIHEPHDFLFQTKNACELRDQARGFNLNIISEYTWGSTSPMIFFFFKLNGV